MVLVRQKYHLKLFIVLVSFLIILQNQGTESRSGVKGKNEDDYTYNTIPDSTDVNKYKQINKESSKCKTTACKTEASRLLYYMDHAADYHENFNDYACGGMKYNEQFIESDPDEVIYKIIEDELNKIGNVKSISTSQKSLRRFYKDCLNYENVLFEERVMKGKSFWSSTGLKYVTKRDSFDLTSTIKTLIQLDSFPIFHIGLEIDRDNTNQLVLKLTTPDENNFFNLENEKQEKCTDLLKSKEQKDFNYHKTKFEFEKCMANLSEYMSDTKETLLKFQTFGDNYTEALSWVERRLKPLMEIAGRKPKDSYEVDYCTVSNLQQKFKLVNWKDLFSSLFNKTISGNDKVQVHYKNLKLIFNEIGRKGELWELNNALLVHLTQNIYKYFVKPENSYNNREKFCLKVFSDLVPDVASNLLMKNVGSETLNGQQAEVARFNESVSKTLAEEVDDVFKGRWGEESWLDEKSVTAIKKKINSLKYSLPAVQRLKINVDLNFNEESKDNNFIANTMALIRRRNNLIHSLHGMASSSPEVIWLLYSKFSSQHGLFIYETNTIAIPEYILLKHKKEFPDAVNLARLGFEIASGFIRAFDKTGIKFDHENKYVKSSILSHNSYYTLEKSIDSLKNENGEIKLNFGKDKSYIIKGGNDLIKNHAFSLLIVNEKISDVGSAKLAFEALKRYGRNESEVLLWGDFSKEELYFLTLEQTFCTKKTILDFLPNLLWKGSFPPFLRERDIFSNSHDFISTFSLSESKDDSIIRPFPFFKKFLENLEP